MEIVGIEPAGPQLTREETLERALIQTQRQLAQQTLVLLDVKETELMDRVQARLAAETPAPADPLPAAEAA